MAPSANYEIPSEEIAIAEYSLAGYEIETPLVNAAGSVSGTSQELILREVDSLAFTAIGAITVGSFTIPEQPGNEARFGGPVYYHDRATGTTYNSMGLPNIGLVAAKKLMPDILARAHEKNKPVIVSVSPTQTAESQDPFQQIIKLVYEMQLAEADLIEVNTSCPNIVTENGARKPILGYDLESMYRLIEELEPWVEAGNSKVGVKLPPYATHDEKLIVPELARILKERSAFDFITTANTIPGQIALNGKGQPVLAVPEGRGGMSGPATKEIGRDQLRLWHQHMLGEIEIVSTLGVDSGKELAIRRELGATAAGGVTFLWESSNWGAKVTDLITDWASIEV